MAVIDGEILGSSRHTDSIDGASTVTPYSTNNHLSWQQTSASGGVLSLINSSGQSIDALALAGAFTQANFTMTSDGSQGTLIEVVNPPPPAGTTADMIMRDGSNGDYEIYDLGNNAILAAYALGQIGTEWQVAGLGGFNGTDTTDMILRDSNNGAFEIYDISNNNITDSRRDGPGRPGVDGLRLRRFLRQCRRNRHADAQQQYRRTSKCTTSATTRSHSRRRWARSALEWEVAGFGDFSGHAGETGTC